MYKNVWIHNVYTSLKHYFCIVKKLTVKHDVVLLLYLLNDVHKKNNVNPLIYTCNNPDHLHVDLFFNSINEFS